MTFSVTVSNLINLILISSGMGVCGLCFMHITSAKHLRKEVRRYFQFFFLVIILYNLSHLARQLMDGIPGSGIFVAQHIVTFTELFVAGLMSLTMSLLVLTVANPGKHVRTYFYILLALFVVHTVLLIIGRFFDFIYYFDDSNVYNRGPGYILSNICPVLMLLVDAVLLIRYRKGMDIFIKTAFWNYIIAPFVAVAIQFFFYELQLIIFATVVAAIYMFGVIIRNQNEKYEKQQIKSSRIESELTLASNIQADMLPNIYPAFPDRTEFDIYATMDPAKEVGGDFYDFFLIDNDHLCMVMADVSGKGVPAALFMMASKIILANNAIIGKSPAEVLTDTNAAICSNNREEMFVTVWLGILEISTGKLTAANAGHEYPCIKHANGAFELYKDKHGLVVGGMDGVQYKQYEIMLEPGSKLFLYTDGVPEATNRENEMFGAARMIDALNNDSNGSPEQILKNVRKHIEDFSEEAEQFDDLTMLCMEYRGTGE